MTYSDTKLFINGTWCDALDGATINVISPSTGERIGVVACAAKEDLERAASASEAGFAEWRNFAAVERARIMRGAAMLLRERVETIASLLTQEQGKPLAEARAEVFSASEIIEWFADEGLRVYGRVVPSRSQNVQQLVLKEPVGPVVAFTPWNFPVNQIARKLSAALTTGCSFIVKAPEETPASPAALIRAFSDAGVPRGVLGLVFGNPAEVSEFLVSYPAVRKVTFTGSTAIGKQLASLAGRHMKRTTMELGGHAPVIIAADADVEEAAKVLGAAKFRNAGQVCVSPTRFLVHNSLRGSFEAAMVAYAEQLQIGDGLEKSTSLGPLANKRRLAAMKEVVSNARESGARLLTGGNEIGDRGNFFAPTVLSDVPLTAAIFNEEPFGPVAAIRGFDALDEAISEANRLPYGLAGYAFTNCVKSVHQLSQRLNVGMLWINQGATPWPEMPFGGVGDSGYGSEGGPEALEPYLVTKAVTIKS
ncbi:NAD-dependent succinate-semialdehyde dehydrogenase [Paraburkholderia rhynchosiae]|uniref:NAD-dependent succinate-semialdehyde dehydrogenase n=2 Tax=Paraburkholderia rhynchosiae TaxID=487049 RepID=A0ABX4VBH0_9BURK|nr:NAD-dependent succinate-semialdehyde dehydrogenase [Paraburkholderia rhynchosiae]PMS33741.1 NAD-dependent succinate-semialdehyde dehydrogenase [Paraburkholderia rhynchosiae]